MPPEHEYSLLNCTHVYGLYGSVHNENTYYSNTYLSPVNCQLKAALNDLFI